MYPFKRFRSDIFVGFKPQACQHGIGYACRYGVIQTGTHVVLVQFLKEAAFFGIHHFLNVIGDIVLPDIDTSRGDDVYKSILVFDFAKAIFKSFDKLVCLFGLYLPQLKRRFVKTIRVLNVIHVFQSASAVLLSDKGNPLCSSVQSSV